MWSITGEESDVNLAVELWLQVSKRREIKILERRSRRQKRMQRSQRRRSRILKRMPRRQSFRSSESMKSSTRGKSISLTRSQSQRDMATLLSTKLSGRSWRQGTRSLKASPSNPEGAEESPSSPVRPAVIKIRPQLKLRKKKLSKSEMSARAQAPSPPAKVLEGRPLLWRKRELP